MSMENEMLAMPFVVGLIIFTAFLTAVVSQAIPYVPKWWNAFIERIKRKKTPNNSIERRIEQLEMRVELHTKKDGVYLNKFDELEEQIQNVSTTLSKREVNRKHNIRRDIREYLEELRDGK